MVDQVLHVLNLSPEHQQLQLAVIDTLSESKTELVNFAVKVLQEAVQPALAGGGLEGCRSSSSCTHCRCHSAVFMCRAWANEVEKALGKSLNNS